MQLRAQWSHGFICDLCENGTRPSRRKRNNFPFPVCANKKTQNTRALPCVWVCVFVCVSVFFQTRRIITEQVQ